MPRRAMQAQGAVDMVGGTKDAVVGAASAAVAKAGELPAAMHACSGVGGRGLVACMYARENGL